MFCPNCGVEDRQQGQFCRACGADLSGVRSGLIRSESTAPEVTAREEIGRAVAAKIRDLHSAKELKTVVEDVLPKVEQFLEAPEERRLRRIRTGVITSGIGLGAFIFFTLVAVTSHAPPVIGIGVVAFLIGLAILFNGWLFTVRPRSAEDAERDRLRDMLGPAIEPAEPRYLAPPASVVENTTRNLEDRAAPVSRPRATGE